MTQNIPIETYITLEKEFGQAIAEKVTSLLDFSFAQAEKKVEQIATQKKLEIRDELSKELASKADLAVVEARLDAKITSIKSEFRVYFTILLCVIVILNKDSITLIGQLFGLVK